MSRQSSWLPFSGRLGTAAADPCRRAGVSAPRASLPRRHGACRPRDGARRRVSRPRRFDPAVYLRSWNFSHLPAAIASGSTRRRHAPTAPCCASTRWSPSIGRSRSRPAFFPAWTFNGQVPGPTIRATEGDRSASPSSTPGRTRTRSTFTGGTRRRWTGRCPNTR